MRTAKPILSMVLLELIPQEVITPNTPTVLFYKVLDTGKDTKYIKKDDVVTIITGIKLPLDGKEYVLCREEDLLAKIE